jgi:hypothetical protein
MMSRWMTSEAKRNKIAMKRQKKSLAISTLIKSDLELTKVNLKNLLMLMKSMILTPPTKTKKS